MSQLYKLKFINFKKQQQIEAESNTKIDELIKRGIQNLNLNINPKPIIVANTKIQLNSQLIELSQVNNNLTIKLENMITVEFHSEDFKTNDKKKVNFFDTIIELNSLIYKLLGLQNHYQIIYNTNDLQLNPLKTLYKMGIAEGAKIDYRIICTFFIYYQDEKIFFQCKINDTFQQIKQIIRQKLNINDEFNLSFEIKNLDPTCEYFKYSIPQNSLLSLMIKESLSVRVQFKDSIHNINVHFTETVYDLINYFTQDYTYILKNGDTKLAPRQTFQELNLQENVQLTLLQDQNQEEPEQVFSLILTKITIKYQIKQYIDILEEKVLVGEKFQTLIDKIKSKIGSPTANLYLNNRQIDPNSKIEELHQREQFLVLFD